MQLDLARHAHRDRERLGIMDLDIHVDRWLEAHSEELNLLCHHEGARPGQQGLESVLVIFNGP